MIIKKTKERILEFYFFKFKFIFEIKEKKRLIQYNIKFIKQNTKKVTNVLTSRVVNGIWTWIMHVNISNK